jgi:hypothetical protein
MVLMETNLLEIFSNRTSSSAISLLCVYEFLANEMNIHAEVVSYYSFLWFTSETPQRI